MEKTKNELILEAAFEVFSNKGFHGAKVEEIADRAGVGKGTIYEYFKNKVHLFQEMLVMQIDKYFTALAEGLPMEAPAIDKLHHIVKQHIIFNKGLQSIVNRFMLESGPSLDADIKIKQKMVDTYQGKFPFIQEVFYQGIKDGQLREDIDVETLSNFFFGGLTGITNSMFVRGLELDPDKIATEIMGLMKAGVTAKE